MALLNARHLLLLLVSVSLLSLIVTCTESWPSSQEEFDSIQLLREKRQASDDETTTSVDEETDVPATSEKTTTTTSNSLDSMTSMGTEKKNATAKNFTIDWDEVQRNWEKVLTEEEVKKKWDAMEVSTQNGVRSVLRTIFPQLISMSSDAKVSGNCSAGILKWIISLRYLKGWAIKMLDAIGKPPAGILEGTITMFGNHHQCLKIRAPEEDEEDEFELDEDAAPKEKVFKEFFRGKYCNLELKPWLPKKPHYYGFVERIPSLKREPGDDTVFGELNELAIFLHFVSFRIDLCVPSICSREDIQRVANFLAKLLDFRARVTRCEVQSDSFVDVSYTQAITLVLFIGFLFIVNVATVVAYLLPKKNKSLPSIVKSLSVTNALAEVGGLQLYQKKPKIATLYGLRFFIMIWIILVHSMTAINYQFFREMQTIKDMALKRAVQFMTNSSLQFDSLIIISAFCLGYYNDGKGTWQGIKRVIRKYFRVMPVVMTGVATVILLPLLDSGLIKGPTWGDIVTNQTNACQQTAWTNLFFIQNFWHPTEMCIPLTWVLCVEMQLALVFTLVIGMMTSFKKRGSEVIGWLLLSALVVVGFAANAYEVYINDLPPTWLWTLPDPEQRDAYFDLHLFKPWTHLSVYAIGVGTGLAVRARKKGSAGGPYGKMVTRLVGWVFSALVMALIVFLPNDWIMGNLPDEIFSGFYDGFHRIAWALAHAWILFMIVADVQDHQETMATKILGNSVVVAFGRLSLCALVMLPIVQLLLLSTQQTALFSSPIIIIYCIFGNILLTYIMAFNTSIHFELTTSALFGARDSTIVKEDDMPKFSKPTTYTISSGRNGDIEMSKGKTEGSRL